MNILTASLAIFVAAAWGANAAVTKYAAHSIPPLTLLIFRYLLTGLIFLPFAKKVSKKEIPVLIQISLLESVLTNGAIYTAFKYLSPTTSTLLLQTGAPIAILVACIFGNERIGPKEVLGILISLSGVVVIFGLPDMNFIGCSLILLSRLSWGSTQILYRRLPTVTPATFIAYMSLFAIPFLIPLAWFIEGNLIHRLEGIKWASLGLNMIYQVGVLSLALIIWQRLIARYGVNKVSPFSILQIVFGILCGIFMFNDVITMRTMAGIVLIMGGVIMTAYTKRRKLPAVLQEKKDAAAAEAVEAAEITAAEETAAEAAEAEETAVEAAEAEAAEARRGL